MSLPTLSDWTSTRVGLHQAAQVMGGVRAAAAIPEPNYTHLGLRSVPHGLTTGVLPFGGELILDFTRLTMRCKFADQGSIEFVITGHSQKSLANAVEKALAESGHTVTLQDSKLAGEAIFNIDPRLAVDYAQVLYLMFETLRHFQDSLPGSKSPVVIWPHGFDVSFLWFATETFLEQAPHMAFGFSPYSAGLERPYLYTYSYPIPANLTAFPLPLHTTWHTEGWTGAVTGYDDLIAYNHPETIIEDIWSSIYQAVSHLLHV